MKVKKALRRRGILPNARPRRSDTANQDLFKAGMTLRKLTGLHDNEMIFLSDIDDSQISQINKKEARKELVRNGLLAEFHVNDEENNDTMDELCRLYREGNFLV